jgi:Tol biopolymer transport system component
VWRASGGRLALKVVPRGGGPSRVLFSGPVVTPPTAQPGDVTWIWPYDWSPGGKILVGFGEFVGAGVVGRSRLVVVDARDGQVTTLKDLGRGAPGRAQFSSDGRFVVYDYAPTADDRRDIFVMASDGSGHRPLIAEATSHETVFDWGQDGRLLYVSDRRGTRELFAVPLREAVVSGEPLAITHLVGETTLLGQTTDGTILTEVYLQLSDVLSAPVDPQTGRATRALAPLPRPQPGMIRSQGTYSPSGTRIAFFQKPMFSRATLVVQDLTTGGIQTFPLTTQNPERPVWRPDERAIAFNAAAQNDAGGERVYLLDLSTGNASQLTDQGVQVAFSPDGKYLYYPGKATVVRREIATSSETEIHRGPGAGRALVVSPDGRWLATFLSGTIVLVPTEQGNVRELLKAAPGAGRFMNPMAWSRDGRHLFITVLQAGDVWKETIWRLSVETGEVVDTGISTNKGKINRISQGLDGELAVSVSRGEFEMWAEGLSSFLGQSTRTRR